ncbi:MAG: hypothetical protein MUC88_08935 [Planctomycetes bacterium]|jgi:hypothetical protein|nr:hypothetical protein [Planctomycetota bacterium]
MDETIISVFGTGRARPLVLAGEFWRPLVDLVAQDDPAVTGHVVVADGPQQVVDLLPRALCHGG